MKTAPSNSGALEGVSLIKEFTPLGDLEQAGHAVNSAIDGDYTTAGILAGMALLPNWLEKPLKGFGNKAMRWFKPKSQNLNNTEKIQLLLQNNPINLQTKYASDYIQSLK